MFGDFGGWGCNIFATSLVEPKMETTELLVGTLQVLKHEIHYFVWCMVGPTKTYIEH